MLYRGKPFHKAIPIVGSLFYTSLLQDHLTQPHSVCIAYASPWQRPRILFKPLQQRGGKTVVVVVHHEARPQGLDDQVVQVEEFVVVVVHCS